ncbi:MAG: redoxin domain-containing protein [Pseudomonadales bacterium]|nr:redoxin domain-containing protein [Pseudomonadales bacterium]
MNFRTVAGLVLFISASWAHPLDVGNFTLLDQRGHAHELYYYSDASAIVVVMQGNGCPIVRNLLADLRALRAVYEPQKVRFLMLNSNLQDSRESVADEAQEWGIDFPILVDETQLVGESLGVTRTGEALLIDPRDWAVVYRGPVNDRVRFARQKETASHHYLADSIDSVLRGEQPALQERIVEGCLINFDVAHTDVGEISYADTIVPILETNCLGCHEEGGIGPWQMNSYEMVRGFSPMISEVLLTNRMPPWHADPLVGSWRNDRSISDEHKQTLLRWIEAGSPRGDGPDPLKTRARREVAWEIGQPDFVVELPKFEVPASGVVDYQEWTFPHGVAQSGWLRAVQVIPGDSSVVHHVLYGTSRPNSQGKGFSLVDDFLGGYAPGIGADAYPGELGVRIEAGHNQEVQLHYTPVGKPVADRTKIGFYLHDDPPARILRTGVIMNPDISIPPRKKEHEEVAYFVFDYRATIFQFLPHAHYRGRSARFGLEYPDGSSSLALSVPKYDFNWQTGYWLQEPLEVPAGTRLVYYSVYDNSAQNPANPDPEETVYWGLQSWEEMLFGVFTFAWEGETAEHPVHQRDRMAIRMTMGYMDADLSGELDGDEIPESKYGERLREFLSIGDFDANGSLGLEEWLSVSRKMRRAN